MDAKSVIKQVKEQKNEIRQVYWVACGGSLVDLYPAHCMVMAESTLVESGIYSCHTEKTWRTQSGDSLQPFRRHKRNPGCRRTCLVQRGSGRYDDKPSGQCGGQ